MVCSKAAVIILAIILVRVWITQASCVHFKSKIENIPFQKSKTSMINDYQEPTRIEKGCPLKPSHHSADYSAQSRSNDLEDLDLSITICNSASSEDSSQSRSDKSRGLDSFELVLPSLRVLSKNQNPLRFRRPTKSRPSNKPAPFKYRRVSSKTAKKTSSRLHSNKHATGSSSASSSSYEVSTYSHMQTHETQSPSLQPQLGPGSVPYVPRPYPPSQQPHSPLPSHMSASYNSPKEPSYQPLAEPQPPSNIISPQAQPFYLPQSSPYTSPHYAHPRGSNHPLELYPPPHELPPNPLPSHPYNEPRPSSMQPFQSEPYWLDQPRHQSVQPGPGNQYLKQYYPPQ